MSSATIGAKRSRVPSRPFKRFSNRVITIVQWIVREGDWNERRFQSAARQTRKKSRKPDEEDRSGESGVIESARRATREDGIGSGYKAVLEHEFPARCSKTSRRERRGERKGQKEAARKSSELRAGPVGERMGKVKGRCDSSRARGSFAPPVSDCLNRPAREFHPWCISSSRARSSATTR